GDRDVNKALSQSEVLTEYGAEVTIKAKDGRAPRAARDVGHDTDTSNTASDSGSTRVLLFTTTAQ
ncbi:hypothetical protein BaRGS_00026285, partial [Batillaria attramentaria]